MSVCTRTSNFVPKFLATLVPSPDEDFDPETVPNLPKGTQPVHGSARTQIWVFAAFTRNVRQLPRPSFH